ncbi:phosphopantetheine-binding protein [Propionivibrio sp.]|uniref:acyl carrier protein n=1 Tax=Propionivibrio sp. TaxID=2212460 RepID=UPI00262D0BB2|nr:phosphopantetheine-binding protein [Propionivibrio sp.]
MSTQEKLLLALDQALELKGRALAFDASTPLLGALPELDSLGVGSLILNLEKTFQITIDDDEIDGSVFQTVQSLSDFIDTKLVNR